MTVGKIIVSHELADIEETVVQPFILNDTVRSHVHVDAVTNQLAGTPHLHNWLSENVYLLDDGVVIHATNSDTFLLSV